MNEANILKDYIVAELSYTTGDYRIYIDLTKKNDTKECIGYVTFYDKDELIFRGNYENYLKFNELVQKGLIIGTLAEKTKWKKKTSE